MVKKSTLIKKKYYGRKKGKVIPLYGHKIAKRIGRHRFFIQWKTTKKNLPGKIYYGKFYNTRKEAMTSKKRHKTRKLKRRKSRRKRKRRKRGGSECPPPNRPKYSQHRPVECNDGKVICCPPESKCIEIIDNGVPKKRCSYYGDDQAPTQKWFDDREEWYNKYEDLLSPPFHGEG